MTAQIANGGYKVTPKIIHEFNKKKNNLENYVKQKKENSNTVLGTDFLFSSFDVEPLFRNQENINFVKDAMFSSSNEPGGTSYRSRLTNKKYTFAGKTGSSQIKRFTEIQRELEVKQDEIDYLDRDHALFIAFAPYHDPKYAISVLVEHGGTGSSAAAPIAKKIIKKVLDRHDLRKSKDLIMDSSI
jgi:penicillin-binding protein 2